MFKSYDPKALSQTLNRLIKEKHDSVYVCKNAILPSTDNMGWKGYEKGICAIYSTDYLNVLAKLLPYARGKCALYFREAYPLIAKMVIGQYEVKILLAPSVR